MKEKVVSPALWVMVAVFLALTACRSSAVDPSEIPGSGASRGETLFQLNPLGNAPGCATCHSVEPGVTSVGPSLAGIATVAANQETGLSAEDYLRQALLEPDEQLAADYNPGAMPAYGAALRPADVDDLVAYMMTLD